ncbi:tRNA (adenosine(37)-N6)-threonylcarbamoyltransferase complex dimerization subunit type 1 TsaB [Pelagibacteraceae bacterium]|jgi:tRNA threonylcarbamoyladenosine biosynthesis protein TsaB|nr:tRNA (adenosine(37)-N6)-threonylcarbamoyltransferase complex dimerization subunit type 1 TsaB [Pelagibacteraceae bacterium]
MNFLSIDCSTSIGSLFVKTKNKTFNKLLQSEKLNNDLLMKQILDFFRVNNLKFSDISHIFVNQGPGNFSGLRGSLATAKGISLAKNLNISGYDTFIWSCVKFFNQEESICSIIKFREKYFLKNYNKNLNSLSNIQEVSKEEIIKKYNKEFKVVPKKIAYLFDKKILKLKNLNIVDLDHKELEFLELKGLLEAALIKPLYLS